MATRTMAEVSTGKRTMASFRSGPTPPGVEHGFDAENRSIRLDT
jgi:hypothetical protein